MFNQQMDHELVEEGQSSHDATYADNQNNFLQFEDWASLAQPGSDEFLETQQSSSPFSTLGSQEPANNDFLYIYLDQGVEARQSHHQQYMKARSATAASASAQYGERLSIYLSLLVSN